MTENGTRVDLKTERLRRGMSQREFAEAAGVTEDVIGHAERTGNTPRPSHAASIAQFLEVDMFDIWERP